MKTYMDIIWLVDSGEISQQNGRCRDCKCDSWGANVLWVQKPAVLFCLFFFLPGLTIQFYLQETSTVWVALGTALGSCFPSHAANCQQATFPPAGRMLHATYFMTAGNGVSLISL